MRVTFIGTLMSRDPFRLETIASRLTDKKIDVLVNNAALFTI